MQKLTVSTYHRLLSLKRRVQHGILRNYRLRRQGFKVVNPYFEDYQQLRGAKLQNALADVLAPVLPNGKVRVMLELGCYNGSRVTPVLKAFADQVWGVDLLPASEVANCDRYFQADMSKPEALLRELADECVDILLLLNYTGIHPTSTWGDFLGPGNNRLQPYLAPQVFPRILKRAGYLICIEWEARPEERVGRRTAAEINAEYDALYSPVELPGFSRIAGGFSDKLTSPYLIFKKL